MSNTDIITKIKTVKNWWIG